MSTQITTFRQYCQRHIDQIRAALPAHMSAERMIRLAQTQISQNRALAECEPISIFAAVITASQLGLEIGVGGQGFIVPYRGRDRKMRAQFVPGWQGLVDLVTRSGRGTVWTGAVFQGDDFEFQLGDSPFVRHRPRGARNPDRLSHTYAVGWVNNAKWPIVDVWHIDEIWAHRDRFNRVGEEHYSYAHPEMYARKVPLMQVLKYMPRSTQINAAMDLSHRADEGRPAILGEDFVIIEESEDDDRASLREQVAAARRKPARRDREQEAEPPALDEHQEPSPALDEHQEPSPVADVAPGIADVVPITQENLLERVEKAETIEALDEIRTLSRALSDEERAPIMTAIGARVREMIGRQ